ncbi:MAG: hypothetical protein LBH14_08580 [Desulfobulbaceae bacterium]|jgi:chromosome segregation ATPase|nr:hypothetical protein [Desulfobulbaceae bacterium]
MGQNSELVKLEEFVSKLRQGFREMKAECARLVATIEEREATIADLEAKLADRASERANISDRVNRLIEQIEELDLVGGETVAHQPVDDRQRNLFPLD